MNEKPTDKLINQPTPSDINKGDKIDDRDFKIKAQEREINELKRMVFGIKDAKSETDKVKSLMGQIDELTKQLITLREQNERLKSLADDELMMVEKVETKEIFGKKSKVMAQIEEGKRAQETQARLNLTIQTLRRENERLKSRGFVEKKVETLHKEIIIKNNKIDTKEKELKKEQEKSNQYLSTMNYYKRQLDDLNRKGRNESLGLKEISDLRRQVTERNGEIDRLRRELSKPAPVQYKYINNPDKEREMGLVRSKLRKVELELEDAMSLIGQKNKDIDRLTKETKSGNQSDAALKQKNNEIRLLRNRLIEKDNKINSLEMKIKELDNSLAYLNKKLAGADPNLGRAKSTLEAEKEDLLRQIESQKNLVNIKNKNIKELNEQLIKNQKKNMESERKAQESKNSLETLMYQNKLNGERTNKEVDDLKGVNKSQEQTIKQLNDLLDQYRLKLTTQMNELDSLHKKTEGLSINDDKTNELNLLLKTKDNLIKQKEDENAILKRNNDFYKKSIGDKDKNNKELRLENQRLMDISSRVRKNRPVADNLFRKLKSYLPDKESAEFKSHSIAVGGPNNNTGVERMVSARTGNDMAMQYEDVERREMGTNVSFKGETPFFILTRISRPENQQNKQSIKDLLNTLEAKNNRLAALTKKNEELSKTIEQLKEDLDSIRRQRDNLESDLRNLKADNDNERDQIRNKAYTFAQKNNDKSSELDAIRQQMKDLNDRLDKMNADLLHLALNAPVEPGALSRLLKENKDNSLKLVKSVFDQLRQQKEKDDEEKAEKEKGSAFGRSEDNDMKEKYEEVQEMNQQMSKKLIDQYDFINALEEEIKDLKNSNDKYVEKIKETSERVERVERPERPSFRMDGISVHTGQPEMVWKEELERVKIELDDWKKKYMELRDDIVKKKRAMINELVNFVNTKNAYENNFFLELNKG